MKAKIIREKIQSIEEKGYQEGLTKEDFKELTRIQNSIDSILVGNNDVWYEIYKKIEWLKSKIYESRVIHDFSKENCQEILRLSPLLPLVLANNKDSRIKLYKDNSYMFLCQFHTEKTPSMGVTDRNSLLYCFGCGIGLNTISYIKEKEKLTFKEAIELLSQIYLYNIGYTNQKLVGLKEKYQKTILSEEYKKLLDMGYERLMLRRKEQEAKSLYEERYQMIERIKNIQNHPEFHYQQPPKMMYLKK